MTQPQPAKSSTPVCEHCDNSGLVRVHGAEDYGVSFESEYCSDCEYGQALIRIDQLEAELHEGLEALRRIARQGLGSWSVTNQRMMGATGEPWKHWAEIAREALNE